MAQKQNERLRFILRLTVFFVCENKMHFILYSTFRSRALTDIFSSFYHPFIFCVRSI